MRSEAHGSRGSGGRTAGRCGRLLLCSAVAFGLTVAIAGRSSASPTLNTTPPDSIGIRLVTQAKVEGSPSIYMVDHVGVGSVTHQIEVTNTASSATHVVLYAAAASIERGSFLGSIGRTANDVSSWTSVSPTSADISAHQTVSGTVTITVPRMASAGERYGVVWAQTQSAPGASGIVQVSRVGIRIYLTVGPGGPPAANFAIEALSGARSTGGQPQVLSRVHNTGGRALDIHGTLQLLRGPGGLTAGPIAAELGATLAVGSSESVVVTLDRRMPAGPWDARIVLDSGLLSQTRDGTITFPAARGTGQDGLTAMLAAIVTGLVIVALVVTVIRQRQRRVTI